MNKVKALSKAAVAAVVLGVGVPVLASVSTSAAPSAKEVPALPSYAKEKAMPVCVDNSTEGGDCRNFPPGRQPVEGEKPLTQDEALELAKHPKAHLTEEGKAVANAKAVLMPYGDFLRLAGQAPDPAITMDRKVWVVQSEGSFVGRAPMGSEPPKADVYVAVYDQLTRFPITRGIGMRVL